MTSPAPTLCPDDPITQAQKGEWLRKHLRCPQCRDRGLLRHTADAAQCTSCGACYPVAGETFNFLTPDMRERFNIATGEKVSDHPYDARALGIIAAAEQRGGFVLDCGSGYRTCRRGSLVQLEIAPFPNVDVLGVNQALPFVDGCFDAVLSLDVLEHVNDPFLASSEIARVLRPGGVLYVDVPFLQHEHGYPHHYFNVTRMGLQRLFEGKLDFEEHYVPNSGHPIYALHAIINCYHRFLPPEVGATFAKLTMQDFLDHGPKRWYPHAIFSSMPAEKKWIIASTTRAVARKPAQAA